MCVFHRRHTGERPFGCLKCGKRYFRKENLLIHEIRDCARVQVSEKRCCVVFYIKSEPRKYNISVKLQTYTCLTCSSTFSGKEELRLHVVSHTGDMPHKVQPTPNKQRTNIQSVISKSINIFIDMVLFFFSVQHVLNSLCTRKT